jgi:ABC-type long-subunit fatty acid transport system fused permease/ATPase subunit
MWIYSCNSSCYPNIKISHLWIFIFISFYDTEIFPSRGVKVPGLEYAATRSEHEKDFRG